MTKRRPLLLPLLYLAAGLLLATLAILPACSSMRAPAAPAGPVVVVLGPQEQAEVAPGTTLRLERVNDSRCRVRAVCVWAGYISFSFTVSDRSGSTPFVLAEDMPGGTLTVVQRGLRFTLTGFDPKTPPKLRGPAPAYRVSVQVSKA